MRPLVIFTIVVMVGASGCSKSPEVTNASRVRPHSSGTNEPTAKEARTEAELGLPFYPGSARTEIANFSMGGSEGEVVSSRATKDPASKVVAFYKARLLGPQVMDTTVTGKTRDGLDVSVTAMPGDVSGETDVLVTVAKN